MSIFCCIVEDLDKLLNFESNTTYGICQIEEDKQALIAWMKKAGVKTDIPARNLVINAYENACNDTKDETMQAMEAAIHNFNSLARVGA